MTRNCICKTKIKTNYILENKTVIYRWFWERNRSPDRGRKSSLNDSDKKQRRTPRVYFVVPVDQRVKIIYIYIYIYIYIKYIYIYIYKSVYWGKFLCCILTSTRPNMPIQSVTPEGSDTSQWPVIERNRVGGNWLTKWDKVKILWYTHRLMHRKRVTCELHDSYFRLMTIKHTYRQEVRLLEFRDVGVKMW